MGGRPCPPDFWDIFLVGGLSKPDFYILSSVNQHQTRFWHLAGMNHGECQKRIPVGIRWALLQNVRGAKGIAGLIIGVLSANLRYGQSSLDIYLRDGHLDDGYCTV